MTTRGGGTGLAWRVLCGAVAVLLISGLGGLLAVPSRSAGASLRVTSVAEPPAVATTADAPVVTARATTTTTAAAPSTTWPDQPIGVPVDWYAPERVQHIG